MSNKMSNKMSDKDRSRMETILKYLESNESITSSTAAELIGEEIKTANRLLVKAVKLDILISKGKNKARIYLVKE